MIDSGDIAALQREIGDLLAVDVRIDGRDLADFSFVDEILAAVVNRDRAVGLLLRGDVDELREVRQGLVALIGQADRLISGLPAPPVPPWSCTICRFSEPIWSANCSRWWRRFRT